MTEIKHLSMTELENSLYAICQSPKTAGVLALIVRRPADGQREVLETGELSLSEGLVGDFWRSRSRSTPDGTPGLANQLTVMNSRVIGLLAQAQERWPLAGDQLYVDLDLSVENLSPGTRLAIGAAVIEVNTLPHTGCDLFMGRFGQNAVKFVNSPAGKQLRLRGLNAKVIQPGVIHAGDQVKKLY